MDVEAILDAICAQRGMQLTTLPVRTRPPESPGLTPSQPDYTSPAPQSRHLQDPSSVADGKASVELDLAAVPPSAPRAVDRAASAQLDGRPIQLIDPGRYVPLRRSVRIRAARARKSLLEEAQELVGDAAYIPPDQPVQVNDPHTHVPLQRSTRIRTFRVQTTASETITINRNSAEPPFGQRQRQKFARLLRKVKNLETLRAKAGIEWADEADKLEEGIRNQLERRCASRGTVFTKMVKDHPRLWKYLTGPTLHRLKLPQTSVKNRGIGRVRESSSTAHQGQPSVEQAPASRVNYPEVHIKQEPEEGVNIRALAAATEPQSINTPDAVTGDTRVVSAHYTDKYMKYEHEKDVETRTSTAAPRTETQGHSTHDAPVIPRSAARLHILVRKRTPSVDRRQRTPSSGTHQRTASVGRRPDGHDPMNPAARARPSASREY